MPVPASALLDLGGCSSAAPVALTVAFVEPSRLVGVTMAGCCAALRLSKQDVVSAIPLLR